MEKISKYLEFIILIIFVSAFLWVGLANPYLNQIKHSRPYAYLASDAFFHQSVADYMETVGKIKFTPSYEVGGHPLVYDQHPPVLFELSSLLAKISGLEVYDSMYLIVSIIAMLIPLVFYLLARKVKKGIAYLSLPITFLIFSKGFNVLFFWGFWLFVTGVFFMITVFWALANLHLKRSYLLLGIFLAATSLSHIPETFYAGIFIFILIIIDIIKNKKININLIKKIIVSSIIMFVLSIHYIIVFSKTMLLSEGYRNVWDLKNMAALSGLPETPLTSLGIAGIVALIGFIFFLLIKKEKTFKVASISIYSFSLGYFILLGVAKRSYIHRLFWFVYISFFFGFGIYQLIRIINKKYIALSSCFIAIALILIITLPLSKNTKVGSGVVDQDSWNALLWIRNNIPSDSRVYYFYSDAFSHKALMYNSYHVSFIVNVNNYIEKLQKGLINRRYLFSLADSYHDYLCPLSRFSFGYYRNRLMPKNNSNYKCEKGYRSIENVPEEDSNKDICDIEYMVFTKATMQPVLAQYNMAIRNTLLQSDWIEEIYSNNMISILKNNKPGVDCIGTNQ